MKIIPYTPEHVTEWNTFVARAVNATFLLRRDYMDYHSARFVDASLLIYHGNRLLALLPANRREDGTIASHDGLTYGGLIVAPRHTPPSLYLEIWQAIIAHLAKQGTPTLVYKPLPHIYSALPEQLDTYALIQLGAQITRCQPSGTIPLQKSTLANETQRQLLRHSRKMPWTIETDTHWHEYWQLLTTTLTERHDAVPVHTLAEILALKEKFPHEIHLTTLINTQSGNIVGGIVSYHTPHTIHTQYIAISPEGREAGALPLLLQHLSDQAPPQTLYLDLGTSTLPGTSQLNVTLADSKYNLGARTSLYTTLTLPIK